MMPKLLITDDDEEIRSQMKWALASDYEVLLAEDRPGALAMFREHRPLVALLDLGLPPDPGDDTEGFEALAALLVAFDDVAGLGIDHLLLQPVAGFPVDHVKTGFLGGGGGRIEQNGTRNEGKLQGAFPVSAGSHGISNPLCVQENSAQTHSGTSTVIEGFGSRP
jgi:hypothetical protein